MMTPECEGAPRQAPRAIQPTAKVSEQSQTVAFLADIRRRRAAPRRDPMADLDHDPYDLAATGARTVEYTGYDVTDLGLTCYHGETCTGRHQRESA